MTKTKQFRSQAVVAEKKNTASPFSIPEEISEKEKTEYIKILDGLCAVLEKYSSKLTKKRAEITGHRSRRDKLQIHKKTSYEIKHIERGI